MYKSPTKTIVKKRKGPKYLFHVNPAKPSGLSPTQFNGNVHPKFYTPNSLYIFFTPTIAIKYEIKEARVQDAVDFYCSIDKPNITKAAKVKAMPYKYVYN